MNAGSAAAPWLLRFVAASRPAELERIATALAALLHPAVDRHREMLAAIGTPDLLRTDGQLFVYRNAAQLGKDRSVSDLRRRHGARFEVIDREDIGRLKPGRSRRPQGVHHAAGIGPAGRRHRGTGRVGGAAE